MTRRIKSKRRTLFWIAIIALALFLLAPAVSLVNDYVKELLKPFPSIVWGLAALALIILVAKAIWDYTRPPKDEPKVDVPQVVEAYEDLRTRYLKGLVEQTQYLTLRSIDFKSADASTGEPERPRLHEVYIQLDTSTNVTVEEGKGKDKGRWSIGIKLCWLLNDFGRVITWDWNTMNVPDKTFNPLAEPLSDESIILADPGFRDKNGIPENMQICKKGTWNQRMFIETAFSMVTLVTDLKRIRHRVAAYMDARLAYVMAMFNVLLKLFAQLHPEEDLYKMSIAQFSL